MNVFIVGTGLIGGSFSLDIQEAYPEARVYGIDRNLDHLAQAKSIGIIHDEGKLDELSKADIVFITVPVDASLILIPEVLDAVSENTVVIDAGSTKHSICEKVKDHPKRHNFLATHPIAGTEFSGPKAALKGLYKGKTNIICEVEKTAFKLQEIAMEIFAKIGMRIRYMDPTSHDKHIAYVSHLSHNS
jgi:prephenate dehydrogenase